MKEEDIFGQEPYETFISFKNCRFQFALSRRCRLYRYEKLLGINFSVFFDHIDEETIRNLPSFSYGTDPSVPDDIYLEVEVKALNHNDKKFHELGKFNFSVRAKEWVTNELRVSSDFIGDESDFTIKFRYMLLRTEGHMVGFMKKRRAVMILGEADPAVYQLETQISAKGGNQEAFGESDDTESALDALLAQKGIR